MTNSPATPKSVRRAKKSVVRVKKRPAPPLKRSKEETEEIHRRQDEALTMRIAGMTYKQIAEAQGRANPSSAKQAVDAAIWRTEKEAAKEVVALDLARLDEYQMRCTHALRTIGDLGQIDRLIRIMTMRYSLLGISDETFMALQQEHGIGGGTRTTNNHNNVQIVMAAPDTEDEFVKKMMLAVGINPESPAAKEYREIHEKGKAKGLPMLAGSANETAHEGIKNASQELDEDEIVDAEIVEELG